MALSAGAAGVGLTLWVIATGQDPWHWARAGAHFEGIPLPADHPAQRARAGQRAHWADHAHPGDVLRSAGDGQGLAVAEALPQEPPLAYRFLCVWGQPGTHPYTGSVVQALQAAHLPDKVVREVSARVAARRATDRVVIRREGIVALASGRRFDPNKVALTFGNTMCLSSRVNFVPGHTESGDLYEAADERGRMYAVMVPEVCGNVSVLSEQGERRSVLQAAFDPGQAEPLRRLPAVLEGGRFRNADSLSRNDVPEPGTLACVLAGLGALALARRVRRARRGAADRPRDGRR